MNQKGFAGTALMIVLGLIIVVTGAVLYTKYTKNDQRLTAKEKTVVNACKLLFSSDRNAGFQCILGLGKTISDARSCATLADVQQSKDPDVQKQDFVALCQTSVATAKKDASICLSISSFSDKYTTAFKNTCLISIAKLTKDQTICNNILTDTERSLCVASTKSGIEQCQALATDDQKNNCYNTLARHDGDVKICDSITSGKDANQSREFCITTVAYTINNWQMCNTITTVTARDSCVDQVIILNNLDRSLCSNAGTYKDRCLRYPVIK